MFTGLVADLGRITTMTRVGPSARLTIETRFPTRAGEPDALARGESIACDGVCLTVVEFGGGAFAVDVSEESLARSTLGAKRPGDPINLERALAAGARMGGHIVQGHVDGVGVIRQVQQEGEYCRFTIDAPAELMPYFVEKGSVALDGVSLTINGLVQAGGQSATGHSATGLWVMLIPETLAVTTLGRKRPGDQVNIEVDVLAKYVERLLESRMGAVSEGEMPSRFDAARLRDEGF